MAANVATLPTMPKHPIADAALDDRLAFVGTSGSGKTYNAGTAVERLLKSARVGVIDPLGVWWGLRLLADGKRASPGVYTLDIRYQMTPQDAEWQSAPYGVIYPTPARSGKGAAWLFSADREELSLRCPRARRDCR